METAIAILIGFSAIFVMAYVPYYLDKKFKEIDKYYKTHDISRIPKP